MIASLFSWRTRREGLPPIPFLQGESPQHTSRLPLSLPFHAVLRKSIVFQRWPQPRGRASARVSTTWRLPAQSCVHDWLGNPWRNLVDFVCFVRAHLLGSFPAAAPAATASTAAAAAAAAGGQPRLGKAQPREHSHTGGRKKTKKRRGGRKTDTRGEIKQPCLNQLKIQPLLGMPPPQRRRRRKALRPRTRRPCWTRTARVQL